IDLLSAGYHPGSGARKRFVKIFTRSPLLSTVSGNSYSGGCLGLRFSPSARQGWGLELCTLGTGWPAFVEKLQGNDVSDFSKTSSPLKPCFRTKSGSPGDRGRNRWYHSAR